MKITTRRATLEDIPWLIEKARDHARLMGYRRPLRFTDEYGAAVAAKLISDHVVIVAQDAQELRGFIGAQVGRHPFDQSIRVLSEILWWVEPGFRGRRAAAALLRAYVDAGTGLADWVICSHAYDPAGSVRPALVRRGFRELERAFLLEV